MPEEIQKPGEGTPAPIPGEPKPEDQPPQGAGSDNQTVELKKSVEDLTKQLSQAEFSIQKEKEKSKKYKDKLTELGEETDEDQPAEKLQETVNEAIKPIMEEVQGLKTVIGEIARANQAKQDAGRHEPGAGGQVPPPKKKEPVLSEEDRKVILSANLHWDSDKEIFVSQDGKRTYDLGKVKGIEIPQV